MDAYRAVVDKRDQRAFLPRPLPEETLRRILQAGRMTGSSKNRESEGVGSCPAHLPEAEVARLLGIPPANTINRVIGFGYVDPASRPPASVARRRLPIEELVHRGRW